jgi:serine protease AprX
MGVNTKLLKSKYFNVTVMAVVSMVLFTSALNATQIRLKYRKFDPKLSAAVLINQDVWADQRDQLFITQFKSKISASDLAMISMMGASAEKYLPVNAYIIKASGPVAQAISLRSNVRWVGPFSSDYKMSQTILHSVQSMVALVSRYDVVLTNRNDRDRLVGKLEKIGATVVNRNAGSILIEANMTPSQLRQALQLPEILWVEASTNIEEDMDNARIQGGADFLESVARVPGYTGIGIRGHVMEGIDPEHQDFAVTQYREKPIGIEDDSYTSHGHQTYGIVFGDGAGNIKARGMMPNAQGYFTAYNFVLNTPEGNREVGSRYELVRRLVNEHQIMFQTASWGYARTTEYNARSAEMDSMIFDHDIPITQSQSNAGNRDSRPQAWAKNIISVGAVYHHDNADPSDDSWDTWGASIGPATDGRIKPDLVAFYDDIETTGREGYSQFGGTSGATPIVAGHLGLTLEMWTDGIFGNELNDPNGERFDNRPHFTTAKALMINTASQYDFAGETHMLTRVHQGWGFPNLETLYKLRDQIFVVNESDILMQGESKVYELTVAEGAPELKATMTFADPEGNVAAEQDRINDLSLKVTSPSGEVFWGNYGLLVGTHSLTGGQEDTRDTVENVFIKDPAVGTWTVEVIASEVNADIHVETSNLDADYALVVSGVRRPL